MPPLKSIKERLPVAITDEEKRKQRQKYELRAKELGLIAGLQDVELFPKYRFGPFTFGERKSVIGTYSLKDEPPYRRMRTWIAATHSGRILFTQAIEQHDEHHVITAFEPENQAATMGSVDNDSTRLFYNIDKNWSHVDIMQHLEDVTDNLAIIIAEQNKLAPATELSRSKPSGDGMAN